jgi:rhodanese-related sulfurtransferase
MYAARMLPFEISPGALAALRQNQHLAEPFILLDVREPWEVEVASIHGSVRMPMGDIPSRAHSELDPDQHIIAVCHHGVRSMNVAVWLRNQGFEKAQSLAGGINAWTREVDPTVPLY